MGVVSVVVFVAFIIDLVIGDPEGFPHPVIYMGRLIKYLERLVRLRFKSLKMGGACNLASPCWYNILNEYIYKQYIWTYIRTNGGMGLVGLFIGHWHINYTYGYLPVYKVSCP